VNDSTLSHAEDSHDGEPWLFLEPNSGSGFADDIVEFINRYAMPAVAT
jgi:hypothetical protein